MLSLKYIRENIDYVKKSLIHKQSSYDIKILLLQNQGNNFSVKKNHS